MTGFLIVIFYLRQYKISNSSGRINHNYNQGLANGVSYRWSPLDCNSDSMRYEPFSGEQRRELSWKQKNYMVISTIDIS
ncbi:hypothetical protein A3195_10325 [Candidatus Thiodiazotropha endoloripes]|uniref:Uncharacterized protein n=1 Tax=Candidatus Thiodiazotropha endoloripes TaxID=1818881 RepID=A0A1E2UR02_9GAMM|nr:hypothetical protein A3195_10325 [Candidatus Thiodiazotropha endoloripes]ODB89521.1 hypothetical protein A3194_10165 [Candidatus Thiodiazotropha endoloripes]ODB97167.1 hypothetical protein A3196_10575 [Candidatus Thiodiazotropha endoloripes]